jgi:hypothetical protein
MKNIQTIFTITLIFIALATACVKTPLKPDDDCGQLPCPTTTGANVASCMINGEPFVVKGKGKSIGMFNCVSGNTFKNGTLAGGYTLEFYRCADGNNNRMRGLYFEISDSLQIQSYKIGNPFITGCRLTIDGGGFSVLSDSSTIGLIEITKNSNSSVSGKFSFELKDKFRNKIYTCTNGNFDLSK